MSSKYPYLKDSSFLKEFDENRLKEQYARITILNWDEKPIQSIEGRVSTGNINLDKSSAVRRTCNLTLVAYEAENDLTNVDNIISINKKVKIDVGFLNNSNSYLDYDMIWFPMGTYVIIAPSISHSSSGVTISLQLKDKMCLLNGECGGVLPASTTFNEYDTVDETGKYVTIYPTVFQIIEETVNHFGGEQLSKIIISDVDTRIKKVMKWTGSSPLYLITTTENGEITYTATTDQSKITNDTVYTIYEYGTDVGYIYTDLIYTNDLIFDAGSTVCDVLDAIVTYLGNYEYYYDVDGNFIFQEIKNYLNTSYSSIVLDNLSKNDYLIDQSKGKAVYAFDDSNLIISYNNNPQYSMIKNDYIVWGSREDADGNTYDIRYHLAIDEKPAVGNTYQVFFYEDEEDGLTKAKCPLHFDSISDFPDVGTEEIFYMDDSTEYIFKWNSSAQVYEQVAVGLENITTTDWRTELYLQGSAAEPYGIESNYYYAELKNEWVKLYDIKNGCFYSDVLKYPWDIDFFLDFIDSGAAISEISVSNIGRRQKVVVDNDVNCVFEPEVPDLVLLETGSEDIENLRQECINQGQDFLQLDSAVFALLVGGGSSNSAYEYVRDLLYQYTSYNESVTISTIPIYYLEPNTRITIRDPRSGIYGDYMINTISIPLDIYSTMSISCTRALERI